MNGMKTLGIGGAAGEQIKPSKGIGARSITAAGLRELLVKQGYRCRLTGRDLLPEEAALDHVTPLNNGGVNDMSNVQILHCDVNQAKGTMTQEEFIEMCREVVAHNP